MLRGLVEAEDEDEAEALDEAPLLAPEAFRSVLELASEFWGAA